jgi:hypothetical protein
MGFTFTRNAFVSAAGIFAVLSGYAATQDVPVAFIEEVRGPAKLQEYRMINGKPSYSEVIPLKENTDIGRLLYPKDKITCEAGTTARIRIDPIAAKAPNGPDHCDKASDTITAPEAAAFYSQRGKGPLATFDTYVIAGRPKGSESPIYSPADKSVVSADRFEIHWRTLPPLGIFTAILADANGKELARAEKVSGESGTLDPAPFRRALSAVRAADSAAEFRLTFKPESGAEQHVVFGVLSQEQQHQLDGAIAGVGSTTGLLAYLQRAAIYDSFRMYNAVASEYNAALKEAPESLMLLRAALTANSRTGDLQRAREVRDKLQQVEDNSVK